LIVAQKEYDEYTDADLTMALGYRLLASAAIEGFAETMCLDVARIGRDRALKNQPTRAGRALAQWHMARKRQFSFPLRDSELIVDAQMVRTAFGAYEDTVKASHGISGKRLRELIVPIGAESEHLVLPVFDKLDELADARNRAAHLRVLRMKNVVQPFVEKDRLEDLIHLLSPLEAALRVAANTF
jgi:hypothetical protein